MIMIDLKKVAAASNGAAAVAVYEREGGGIAVLKYAPNGVGHWDRRKEFSELVSRAATKLGYRRNRRFKTGWKKEA
jgi:hypothetical protein